MAQESTGNDTYERDVKRTHVKDKGWSWVVCFAAFVAQAILGGLVYSFGLMYVQFLDYFQRSKGETAWILSICQGISCIGGPVYSAIARRLGLRLSSFVGTFALSSGFIISMWAPSLFFLYFSIGILAGVGFGIIYLVAVDAINQYFNKHRSMAMGITISGVGIGTLAMGPLLEMLLEEYTWKGAILIEGAICLNCLVCGFLYRPVTEDFGRETESITAHELKDSQLDLKEKHSVSKVHIEIVNNAAPNCVKANENIHYVEHEKSKYVKTIEDLDRDVTIELHPFLSENRMEVTQNKRLQCTRKQYVDRININNGRSIYVPEDNDQDLDKRNKNGIKALKKVDIYKELMRNVQFVALLVSLFLGWLGYLIPYLYIVDTARQFDIETSKSKWFISSMGVANIVGRLFSGVIGGFRFVNRLYFISASFVVCGSATLLLSFSQQFIPLIFLAVTYGIFSGGAKTLSVVRLTDVVQEEYFSEALGLHLASCGVSLLVGPPIAGWFFDITGTYLATYLFAGVSFICAGIVPCLPYFTCRRSLSK